MTKDINIGVNNYRKLLYYFENKIEIHFKDTKGIWYNGLILDLNEFKLTLVLKERVRGEIPFLLEDIESSSITKYREEGK